MNKQSQEKLNKITDKLFAEYKKECNYVTEYALKLEYVSENDAERDPEKTEGRIIQFKAEIRRVLEESEKRTQQLIDALRLAQDILVVGNYPDSANEIRMVQIQNAINGTTIEISKSVKELSDSGIINLLNEANVHYNSINWERVDLELALQNAIDRDVIDESLVIMELDSE